MTIETMYTNKRVWENDPVGVDGGQTFALNGVVANWGWHERGETFTEVNPLMNDFRNGTIDIFSNEGGVLWNWVTGDKKYPSVEELVTRINIVQRSLRNDYNIRLNAVRITTAHPKLSLDASVYVARLLAESFLAIERPYTWFVYSSLSSRYPNSNALLAHSRRVYVRNEDMPMRNITNTLYNTIGEPINYYGVPTFYGV